MHVAFQQQTDVHWVMNLNYHRSCAQN